MKRFIQTSLSLGPKSSFPALTSLQHISNVLFKNSDYLATDENRIGAIIQYEKHCDVETFKSNIALVYIECMLTAENFPPGPGPYECVVNSNMKIVNHSELGWSCTWEDQVISLKILTGLFSDYIMGGSKCWHPMDFRVLIAASDTDIELAGMPRASLRHPKSIAYSESAIGVPVCIKPTCSCDAENGISGAYCSDDCRNCLVQCDPTKIIHVAKNLEYELPRDNISKDVPWDSRLLSIDTSYYSKETFNDMSSVATALSLMHNPGSRFYPLYLTVKRIIDESGPLCTIRVDDLAHDTEPLRQNCSTRGGIIAVAEGVPNVKFVDVRYPGHCIREHVYGIVSRFNIPESLNPEMESLHSYCFNHMQGSQASLPLLLSAILRHESFKNHDPQELLKDVRPGHLELWKIKDSEQLLNNQSRMGDLKISVVEDCRLGSTLPITTVTLSEPSLKILDNRDSFERVFKMLLKVQYDALINVGLLKRQITKRPVMVHLPLVGDEKLAIEAAIAAERFGLLPAIYGRDADETERIYNALYTDSVTVKRYKYSMKVGLTEIG